MQAEGEQCEIAYLKTAWISAASYCDFWFDVTYFNESSLKQHLDHLLEDGQDSTVVDSQSSLQVVFHLYNLPTQTQTHRLIR